MLDGPDASAAQRELVGYCTPNVSMMLYLNEAEIEDRAHLRCFT